MKQIKLQNDNFLFGLAGWINFSIRRDARSGYPVNICDLFKYAALGALLGLLIVSVLWIMIVCPIVFAVYSFFDPSLADNKLWDGMFPAAIHLGTAELTLFFIFANVYGLVCGVRWIRKQSYAVKITWVTKAWDKTSSVLQKSNSAVWTTASNTVKLVQETSGYKIVIAFLDKACVQVEPVKRKTKE